MCGLQRAKIAARRVASHGWVRAKSVFAAHLAARDIRNPFPVGRGPCAAFCCARPTALRCASASDVGEKHAAVLVTRALPRVCQRWNRRLGARSWRASALMRPLPCRHTRSPTFCPRSCWTCVGSTRTHTRARCARSWPPWPRGLSPTRPTWWSTAARTG